jgi:hypothetical protein
MFAEMTSEHGKQWFGLVFVSHGFLVHSTTCAGSKSRFSGWSFLTVLVLQLDMRRSSSRGSLLSEKLPRVRRTKTAQDGIQIPDPALGISIAI